MTKMVYDNELGEQMHKYLQTNATFYGDVEYGGAEVIFHTLRNLKNGTLSANMNYRQSCRAVKDVAPYLLHVYEEVYKVLENQVLKDVIDTFTPVSVTTIAALIQRFPDDKRLRDIFFNYINSVRPYVDETGHLTYKIRRVMLLVCDVYYKIRLPQKIEAELFDVRAYNCDQIANALNHIYIYYVETLRNAQVNSMFRELCIRAKEIHNRDDFVIDDLLNKLLHNHYE